METRISASLQKAWRYVSGSQVDATLEVLAERELDSSSPHVRLIGTEGDELALTPGEARDLARALNHYAWIAIRRAGTQRLRDRPHGRSRPVSARVDGSDVIRIDRPEGMSDLDWSLKKEALREHLGQLVAETLRNRQSSPSGPSTLTTMEAAEMAGVHARTVSRSAAGGSLRGVRMDRSWLFDADDVRRWIARQETRRAAGELLPHLPARPLFHQVQLRGGPARCGVRLGSAEEKALERARRSGWVTDRMGDRLAVRLLGTTPWELWGDDWTTVWTASAGLLHARRHELAQRLSYASSLSRPRHLRPR